MSEIIKKEVENKDLLENKPSGTITNVVVYSDRAKITRKINAKLNPGNNTIIFENITPIVEESTLKTIVAKELRNIIKVKGIHTKEKYLAYLPRKEEREVYNELINEIINLIAIMDMEDVFSIEQSIIDQLKNYVKDGTYQFVMEKEDKLGQLVIAKKFITEKVEEISNKLYELSINREDLTEKIKVLKDKLEHIRTPDLKMLKNIYVELEMENNGNMDEQTENENDYIDTEISLSYIVPNVSWQTSYDIRLVEENGNNKAKLIYYGNIIQKTGEDWTDTDVYLTTAQPKSAQIPDIYPVYISGYKRQKPDKELISQQSNIEDSFMNMEEDMSDDDLSSEPETSSDKPGKPEFSEVSKGLISKLFKLAGKNTILSDGNKHSLTIFETELEVTLSYETIPKLFEFVYLKGEMKNNTAYPLLKGKTNIFRKSGYIGSGTMKYVATDETFEVSYGIDEDVKVKRVQIIKDVKKDKIGFNQHALFGYEIAIKNFKKESQFVKIKENVPVSELKGVKVKLSDDTTKGYEHDKKEGILTWTIDIPKCDSKIIKLYYEIEAPKSFNLNNL